MTTLRTGPRVRRLLTADYNYYVDVATGDDANDGSIGAPFETIQHAIDQALQTIDSAGFDVYINVVAGTYTAGGVMTEPLVGGGWLKIVGDTATPSNVLIDTAGRCFTGQGAGVRLELSGMKVQSSANYGVYISEFAYVYLYNMAYGVCASGHMSCHDGGQLVTGGTELITGNAPFHIQLLNQAHGYFDATVTLTGTPAFSNAYIVCALGAQYYSSEGGFTGSATGKRFDVKSNAVVGPAGLSLTKFPGNVAGTVGSGGIYGDVSADISESLLTTRGDVIRRGVSAAERLAIGAADTFFGSDGTDPSWRTAAQVITSLAANGGYQLVTSWTYASDVASVAFTDLSAYRELIVIAKGIVCSISSTLRARLSVNNGSSYYSASGDYVEVGAAGTESNQNGTFFTATSSTTAQTGALRVLNPLAAGSYRLIENLNRGGLIQVFAGSTNVVDAIQIGPSGGGNFTAGNIQLFGRKF